MGKSISFLRLLVLSVCLFAISVSCIAQTKEKNFKRDYASLLSEIRGMLVQDQLYRHSNKDFDMHAAEISRIDSANTARIIAITIKYGFPSTTRFNLEWGELMPHIILVHAPESFFNTLRPLIKQEKDAGRMADFEYEHILWQLNNRVGVPVVAGDTVLRKKI